MKSRTNEERRRDKEAAEELGRIMRNPPPEVLEPLREMLRRLDEATRRVSEAMLYNVVK